jgi:Lecithin:cholesterol acyltransferase
VVAYKRTQHSEQNLGVSESCKHDARAFFSSLRKSHGIWNSRPHIKHVIMAYGVDLPTEVGYVYKKTQRHGEESTEPDGVPFLDRVIWEEPNGKLSEERMDVARGTLDSIVKKKVKREPLQVQSRLQRSGDGTIPYLSLSWAHTWLLHGIRAQRYSQGEQQQQSGTNALDDVDVSHRPKGAMEWVKGAPVFTMTDDRTKQKEDGDTGTTHPHGTKYKPEMVRYHNVGQSRKTGMKYSTTVIEAIGVEHKETTR